MFLVLFDRQMVHTARTHTRFSLRPVDHPLRMLLAELLVLHRAIIEPGNIDFISEFVLDRIFCLVECRCSGPCGVFFMKKTRQPMSFQGPIRSSLLGDLIADAPQDNAWM